MDFEIKMLPKCNIYIINGKKKSYTMRNQAETAERERPHNSNLNLKITNCNK